MTRPVIIAHRGGSAPAAENTLPAFRQALELGVDGIELDLQLGDAGDLVVIHDMITAGDRREDAPRLASVLDLVQALRPRARVVIDLKSAPWTPGLEDQGRRLVDAAASLLQAYPCKDRIILASFDWDALEHASRCLPACPIAFHTMAARWLDRLSAAQTGVNDRRDLLAYLEGWRQRRGPGFEALSPLELMRAADGDIWSCLHRDLTDTAVAKARGLGLAVWTWTVNQPADLARVIRLGVDAVTTDRPDQLLRYLDAQEQES